MSNHASLSQLRAQAGRVTRHPLQKLIADDPARASDFALRVGPVYANFARQHYDREALDALFALAGSVDASGRLQALFDGEKINLTEGRSVLHTALRSDLSDAPVAKQAHALSTASRLEVRSVMSIAAIRRSCSSTARSSRLCR